MAELLFGSPVTLGVAGAALVLIALILWINGGFRSALITAVSLAILTVILLIISLRVHTDREQIVDVLDQVAAAVQQNDVPKVLSYIHPSAMPSVVRAKEELSRFKFTEARVTGIKSIQVDRRTNPPSAIAEFNVAVSVTAPSGQPFHIRRFVRCYFFFQDGRWLVNDYQHFDVSAGFRDNAE
jgi:hypothetical protein